MKLFYKVFFESNENGHNSKKELCDFVNEYQLEVIAINNIGNGMNTLWYKSENEL